MSVSLHWPHCTRHWIHVYFLGILCHVPARSSGRLRCLLSTTLRFCVSIYELTHLRLVPFSDTMAKSRPACSHPTGSMQDIFNILQQYPILESLVKYLSQSELLNLMLTCKAVQDILNPTAQAHCITNLRKKAIQHPKKAKCPACHVRTATCVKCPRQVHVSLNSSIVFPLFPPSSILDLMSLISD